MENYNKLSNIDLYKLFPNKTPLAIYKKAYSMGLRKNQEIQFINRSNAHKREKASNWKGGVRITKAGYKQILMPEHKRADRSGYVMEHIVIFEKESGIEIPDGCCVHHINGIKNDNRIENLCMMTNSGHTIHHHKGRKLSDETKMKISNKKRRRYE